MIQSTINKPLMCLWSNMFHGWTDVYDGIWERKPRAACRRGRKTGREEAGEVSSILTKIQEIDNASVNTCCNMTNEVDKDKSQWGCMSSHSGVYCNYKLGHCSPRKTRCLEWMGNKAWMYVRKQAREFNGKRAISNASQRQGPSVASSATTQACSEINHSLLIHSNECKQR